MPIAEVFFSSLTEMLPSSDCPRWGTSGMFLQLGSVWVPAGARGSGWTPQTKQRVGSEPEKVMEIFIKKEGKKEQSKLPDGFPSWYQIPAPAGCWWIKSTRKRGVWFLSATANREWAEPHKRAAAVFGESIPKESRLFFPHASKGQLLITSISVLARDGMWGHTVPGAGDHGEGAGAPVSPTAKSSTNPHGLNPLPSVLTSFPPLHSPSQASPPSTTAILTAPISVTFLLSRSPTSYTWTSPVKSSPRQLSLTYAPHKNSSC